MSQLSSITIIIMSQNISMQDGFQDLRLGKTYYNRCSQTSGAGGYQDDCVFVLLQRISWVLHYTKFVWWGEKKEQIDAISAD